MEVSPCLLLEEGFHTQIMFISYETFVVIVIMREFHDEPLVYILYKGPKGFRYALVIILLYINVLML